MAQTSIILASTFSQLSYYEASTESGNKGQCKLGEATLQDVSGSNLGWDIEYPE
jgi:hypothetical protein